MLDSDCFRCAVGFGHFPFLIRYGGKVDVLARYPAKRGRWLPTPLQVV
jgi:hypothetical protein